MPFHALNCSECFHLYHGIAATTEIYFHFAGSLLPSTEFSFLTEPSLVASFWTWPHHTITSQPPRVLQSRIQIPIQRTTTATS